MKRCDEIGRGNFARSGRLQVLLIALIGLSLRLALEARLAPYPWPDCRVYLDAGRSLLQTGRIGSNIVMPLYPLFLAGIGPNHVLIVQAVLSTATALIAYYLALQIFRSRLAASLAGLLVACDPAGIFFADQRMSETLFTFLLISSLLLFYRRKYFAGSIVFVMSLLTRPTFDLLAVPLIVAFVWLEKDSIRSLTLPARFWHRAAKCVGIYLVVYIVLMSPWWFHNYEKYGRFVRLDLGDGIIFRLEQSPQFAKYGLDWPKLQPVFHEFDNVKDPVRRDAMYRHAAIAYIREYPLRYLKLCVRRFGRFWSPVIDQDDIFCPRKVRVAGVAMTLFRYVLCVIMLVGMRTPVLKKLFPVLLVIAYLTTVHTLLHALPRYRVPIEPLLCVLASGAVLYLPVVRKWLVGERTSIAEGAETGPRA